MAFSERERLQYDLSLEYLNRFGKCFGVPFHAFDFGTEDFIEELQYSLETGVPFDPDSPRWRWEPLDLPEGVLI